MEAYRKERRKTMTMNWDGLRDDDDEFFESNDRISSVVPLDCVSSGSDDDDEDFDDSRISFASAVSSVHTPQFQAFATTATPMTPDYDIWMASPGSIKERRQRLFQGMGLSPNRELLSFKPGVSNNVPNGQVQTTAEVPAADTSVSKAQPQQNNKDSPKQELSHSPLPFLFVRSRSDGDIESLSIQKKRKEEFLGSISKQILTRTSSLISTQHEKSYPYQENIRASPKDSGNSPTIKQSGGLTSVGSKNRFGAFFLIKNLDTGKEFIVNEYDQDGMWNKLSDLQTGKQLTMEEFEKCLGYSPMVKELMRRENVNRMMNYPANQRKFNSYLSKSLRMSKRRGAAMLRSIKEVANSMTLRGEKDRENVLAMDQRNVKNQWVKVRQTGKSYKELSALHLCQEIQAHEGSIWTIRFSTDTRFLASAGEDKIIHVWEVQECEIMSMNEGSLTPGCLTPLHPSLASSPLHPSLSLSQDQSGLLEAAGNLHEKKKKGKGSSSKKGNHIPEYVHVPETVFSLSDRPFCSFKGHLDDVLDLSWSRSQVDLMDLQRLLSSSMDKTVRLWDLETKSCLKLFAHNDYVTCIHFNPMDDDYFISGSLDAKVRIWNIPDRQVVDWTDLHEMVTAACYTPDGQGALIGSHKGSCRMYSTDGCKLTQLEQITIRNKKKAHIKKITGFQFCPINPSEVLVTSADSRIRILDGSEVIRKFRGFRNTSSQIAASFTLDGKYVISASEDSQVFVWRCEEPRNTGTGKRTMITARSHEHFLCKDVSVAIPWPGTIKGEPPSMATAHSKRHSKRCPPQQSNTKCESPRKEDSPGSNNNKKSLPPLPNKKNNNNNNIERPITPPEEELAQVSRTDTGIVESSSILRSSSTREGDSPSISPATNLNSCSSIRAGDSPSISFASNPSSASIRYDHSPSISSATPSSSWSASRSWLDVVGHGHHPTQATAWGLVIVTATLGGEIRIYQNFGLPRRIGRL
ncbi:WD repeat-containing protein 44-like [Durio zibethinus]|uniref:WD repeat-containing protein 44-like n=1 Tax=Durio zibethinus TaxID=66656 RepID=A0A6P5Z133_DURZI|nr:WD repeat-containing protein 44-like [Durio zibethinus]